MKRVWLVFAWVAATALVSFGTFQVLSLAQSGVGADDLAPVVVASTEGATALDDSETTTTPPADVSDGTSTSAEDPTRPIPPTTPSTSPPSTTAASTTSTMSAFETRTVQSPGGAVTVRLAPGVVEFVGAVPLPGFAVEVDEAGPTRVRVEFESEEARHEVRVEWESGELRVSLD